MGLGVLLHASLPFVPYRRDDTGGDLVLDHLFLAIHGFRMPLFFVLSGFFTAMLLARRGLRSLVAQRLRRVGLPLAASVVTILPLLYLSFILGYVALEVGGGVDQAEITGGLLGEIGDAADEKGGDDGVLSHLWFLWMLLWLMAVMVAVVGVGRVVCRLAGRRFSGASRLRWALLPASLLPQLLMRELVIGPDTSSSLLLAPHVVVFYGAFFAFGALSYGVEGRTPPLLDVARWWRPLLLVAIAAYPIAFVFEFERPDAVLSAVAQLVLAWATSLGLIGLFHQTLSAERFAVRYASDASYWIYLVHLPLLGVPQGLLALTDWPVLIEYALLVGWALVIPALSYHLVVRYTPIGTLLNGKRTRHQDRVDRGRLDRAGPGTAIT